MVIYLSKFLNLLGISPFIFSLIPLFFCRLVSLLSSPLGGILASLYPIRKVPWPLPSTFQLLSIEPPWDFNPLISSSSLFFPSSPLVYTLKRGWEAFGSFGLHHLDFFYNGFMNPKDETAKINTRHLFVVTPKGKLLISNLPRLEGFVRTI